MINFTKRMFCGSEHIIFHGHCMSNKNIPSLRFNGGGGEENFSKDCKNSFRPYLTLLRRRNMWFSV